MFDTFHQEVQNWRRKGGRLRPYVDMSEEAKHLRALIPALTSLLAANGYVKRDYLRRKDKLEVQFSEVQMVRSVPVPPLTTGPTAGQPRPPMKIGDVAGGACEVPAHSGAVRAGATRGDQLRFHPLQPGGVRLLLQADP